MSLVEHPKAHATRLCPELVEVVVEVLAKGLQAEDRAAVRAYVETHARRVAMPRFVTACLALPWVEWEERIRFQDEHSAVVVSEWQSGQCVPKGLQAEARDAVDAYIERVRVRLVRALHEGRRAFEAKFSLRPEYLALPPQAAAFVRSAWPEVAEFGSFFGYRLTESDRAAFSTSAYYLPADGAAFVAALRD